MNIKKCLFILELRAAFSIFDKDNDGIVSMDEFEEMIKVMFSDNSPRDIEDMMATIDPNSKI